MSSLKLFGLLELLPIKSLKNIGCKVNEITIAEKNTKEGNKKFNELKEEFVETFWKDGIPLPDFHDLHASFN